MALSQQWSWCCPELVLLCVFLIFIACRQGLGQLRHRTERCFPALGFPPLPAVDLKGFRVRKPSTGLSVGIVVCTP